MIHWLLLLTLVLQPQGATLRIAVTGDTGKGTDAVGEGIRRVHAEKPLDAILLLGDNFYPCGVTSEHDPRWSLTRGVISVGVPVLPVLGNHDYCGKADPDAQIRATGVVPNWKFPARQYVVRTGVADFAFIDTTSFLFSNGDPQLAEAFRSSTAPWRIVVGHHPVLSSGYHGYFPRNEVKRMRELNPSLRAWRVDLYIAGHDHHVEFIRERMMHLISGAGSEPIPPVMLRLRTVFPPEISVERIAFAVVELDARAIRVRFYGANGRPRSEWIASRKRKAAAD